MFTNQRSEDFLWLRTRMRRPKLLFRIAWSIWFFVFQSPASGIEEQDFALRGFGTLGAACFSTGKWDFLRDERPDGPGRSKHCDSKLDSNFGLQFDGAFGESLTLTFQAVGYHGADDRFTPELTLAHLRWIPSTRTTIRVGRMQNPMFFASEYRNVLYVQPWVRPPTELYNLATAYSTDGAAFSTSLPLKDWRLDLEMGVGKSQFNVVLSGSQEIGAVKSDFAYLGALLERDHWALKAGLLNGRVTYAPSALNLLGLQLVSLGLHELAEDFVFDHKRAMLLGLGIKYETDLWLFQGEYAYRLIDAFNRKQQGAYLLAGRRFGNWMIYGILAGAWSGTRDLLHRLPSGSESDASLQAAIAGVESTVNAAIEDRISLSAGIARPLGSLAILKFQVDYVRPRNRPEDALPSGILTTLNLDFIF